ncbi:hypothetical protein ACOME3_002124 [Neoechinorhynchus agilis]
MKERSKFIGTVCSYRMLITILSLANVSIMYAEKNGFFAALNYMRCKSNETANQTTNDTKAFTCYEWSNSVRSTLIGMVFIGYAISQIFSGWITKKVGIRVTIVTTQTVVFVTTFIIPFAAHASWIFLAIVRFITGFAQGFIWPFAMMMVSYWSPEDERSIHLSIISAGSTVGPFLAVLLSGPLCSINTPTANLDYLVQGYSIYFYVLSILGLIIIVLDLILLSSDPQTNRFISLEEIMYITSNKIGRPTHENKKLTVPYKKIILSRSFLGFLAGIVFSDVGLYATWTIIPDYISESFESTPTTLSIVTSIPYITNLIAIISSGSLAAFLINRGWLSRTAATKIFLTIGCVGAAVCLIPMPYLKRDQIVLAGLCLSIGFGSHGLIIGGGYPLNVSDFAGVFSGVVFTLGNVISNVVGTVLNFLVDLIKDAAQGEKSGWQNVLLSFCGIYLLSALLFDLLASGKLQSWAYIEDEDLETEPMNLNDSIQLDDKLN